MELSESNITEFVLVSHAEVYLWPLFNSLLQDLKTLCHHQWVLEVFSRSYAKSNLASVWNLSALVTAVSQQCLEQAFRCHMTDLDPIHRLILSLIIHCSKDEDHARCIKSLEYTFTCTWSWLVPFFSRLYLNLNSAVCEADVELTTVPTIACLTVSTRSLFYYLRIHANAI